MNRITVASRSEDFGTKMRRALGALDGHAITVWPTDTDYDVDSIVADVAAQSPDLLIIGECPDVDAALDVAERIDLEHPEISVLISSTASATTLERALVAGARGIIPPTATDDEVREMVERALAASKRRRETYIEMQDDSGPRNKIIPVLAAKGGSGKTTVATNLAVALAARFPGDVVIVDLDLQFGDVASAFGFEPTVTFADIGPADLTDATALKAVLSPRQSAGLYVMAAPEIPAQADDLRPDMIRKVIEVLSTDFPFVIIDTAAGIDEFTLEILDVATDIVLLASMDVPSIRAARKEANALQLLGLDNRPWHVVLNRANSKVGLSIEDIQATLGRTIDVTIPSHRSIPTSVNRGVPISLSDPRSPAGKAFAELADQTAGVNAQSSKWNFGRKTS